ncbi:Ankyrin repeat-containing domain protein [Metarhizium brunneum]
MTYDYVSDFRIQNLLDESTLHRMAMNLLDAICRLREGRKAAPLVFLCHNVGGILVKKMLWIANCDPRYLEIASSTRLLILFGTPDGSSPWVDTLFKIVLASTNPRDAGFQHHLHRELLEITQQGPDSLEAATLRFQILGKQYKTFSIYEGDPTELIGIVVPFPTDKQKEVPCLQTTHRQLCSHRDDRLISSLVKEILAITRIPRPDYYHVFLQYRQSLTMLSPNDSAPGHILTAALPPDTIEWPEWSDMLPQGERLADHRRRTYRDLLLDLILQILYQDDAIFESSYVRNVWTYMLTDSYPSAPDLYRFFGAALRKVSKRSVFCVIDALDECDATMSHLIGDFKRLAAGQNTGFKVLITCQPTASIQSLFDSPGINIERYMKPGKTLLSQMPAHDGEEHHGRPILQLQLLKHLTDGGTIGTEMSECTTYNAIYEKILASINAPVEWLRDVLLCIAFAHRPMTVGELSIAMGIPTTTPGWNAGGLTLQKISISSPKDLQDNLKLALGPLVYLENNTIHIHNTLREFVRGQTDSLPWNLLPTAAEGEVAPSSILPRKCLLYLAMKEMQIPEVETRCGLEETIEGLSGTQFLRYAVVCWPLHLKECIDTMVDVQDWFTPFWKDSGTMKWWASTYLSLHLSANFDYSSVDDLVSEPLNLASYLGLTSVVHDMVSQDTIDFSLGYAPTLAIRGSHTKTAEVLLRHKSQSPESWLDALKELCSHGHDPTVELILTLWEESHAQMPDVSELDKCLCIVVEHGHWPVVSRLAQAGARVFKPLEMEHHSLLEHASERGYDGVVNELLALYPRDNGETPEWLDAIRKAMEAAAEFGSASVIAVLAPKANLEWRSRGKSEPSCFRLTPLHIAAYNGNAEAAEVLLKLGAKLGSKDDRGMTPFVLSYYMNQEDTTRVFLDGGADPNVVIPDTYRTRPLHVAAVKGWSASVQNIPEHGAWQDRATGSSDNYTPLHLAVRYPNGTRRPVDVVRALLNSLADVHRKSGDGSTSLHLAIQNKDCNEEVIRLLLDRGADVDTLDDEGKSPLYYALCEKREYTRLLWADRHSGVTQHSVLFNAVARGLEGRVKQLLQAGIDPDERDKYGRIALDVALSRQIRLLLSPDEPDRMDLCPLLQPERPQI